jgi:serine/threonine protein kinase
MSDNPLTDGPRLDGGDPPPPAVFVPRTESEKRQLNAIVANTDNAPTVITNRRPHPGGQPPLRLDGEVRGRRLGHFELIESVGVGGMAAVLRARDLNLGRDVALKILPPEATHDPENVARFRSEARAAAKLDHENIARVFDIGEDQGLHFIAFEFVEGINLRALIEQRGPRPPAEAVQYMLQAAAGLTHAAERGVVHRDIKPSNIIITPAGRAKIVDMGLARHRDAGDDGLTQSGMTLGTFDYISPEQALEPRAADTRSDIYSLGCTFYHVLTGEPPVPAGTAAKKLHHHEHVPPPDPRAANPAITEEMALVLGRMMAKDPLHRYQRPEQLVHDLLALARQLPPTGGPSSVGTDALWVEAPLPAPAPRLPAILTAAAVLAVAVLVALIEVSRPTPQGKLPIPYVKSAPGPVASDSGSHGSETDPPTPVPATTPPVVSRAETAFAAADADELRRLLRDHREPELRIRLTGPGPYDLGSSGGAGLTFRGRKLTLEGADAGQPLPEIHFVAGPTTAGQPVAALAVGPERDGDGVTLILKGVRFVCEPASGAGPPSAVAVSGLVRLDIERCAFAMPELPAGAIVLAGRGSPPEVRLAECLFLRGGRALDLLGPAHVVAAHCAFGPHSALVHLRDTGDADATAVRLDHCSALLESGAVFHAEDGAGGLLVAGHCLFSRPPADSIAESPSEVVLVRQTGSARGRLVYQAQAGLDGQPLRNGYHNLGAFWSDETPAAGPRRALTPDDARRLFPDFHDGDALELPSSPWQDPHPVTRLADSPQAAFAVNTQMARVRLAARLGGVLGVERNVWGPSYPAVVSGDAVVLRTRIVDPALESDPRVGIYATLAQALEAARPDDTILIKKNGPLVDYPLPLYRPDLRLTIKPFPNYRPVLTLAATPDPDAALFRLYDGELTLEGLEFALRAGPAGVKSQAVAALVGNGVCLFRRCVVTLDEAADAQFAAAVVPDADPIVRPGADRRTAPRVRFENCFVRGKGNVLDAHNGRRFELELDSTLAALDGTLAAVEGATKDPPAGLASAQVRLRRATAVLTEHVLALRAARDGEHHGAGLPPTQVSCEESLLVAAAGRPLVRLENVDGDEQVRQLLQWGAGRYTLYGNVGPTLLEMVPAAPERLPVPVSFDQERWLTFTHEPGAASPFVRVRFAVPFAADRLPHSQPGDFKPVRPEFTPPSDGEYGAAVEKLPRAGDE